MKITGKRYSYLNDYLKSHFQYKIRKISFNIGFSCPNRDGTKGQSGCIFCSETGSSTKNNRQYMELEKQYDLGRGYFKKTYPGEGFIAYFQAFTSTYGPIEKLEQAIREIAEFPDIMGLAISTRPDCIAQDTVDVINSFKSRFKILWIELGLQSIHEKSLKWMNRKDSFESFLKAHKLLTEVGIKAVAHCILGLPTETREDMVATARLLAETGLWGVKIHQLHAIKGTRLWNLYKTGSFKHLLLDQYLDILIQFLENLPPDMIIHRMVADHQGETMLFPSEAIHKGIKKEKVLYELEHRLEKMDSFQGKQYLG